MRKDIDCPYCGQGINICHDDGAGYSEGDDHEQECPECGKSFVFNTTIHFSYDARKADCLNGSSHQMALTKTWPAHFAMLRCNDCGHEERPANFGIDPAKQEGLT